MRFFLGVCALLGLASADTIFMEIKMKGVTSAIDQTVLDTLAQSLPGIMEANIPAAYKDVAADYIKYAQNLVVKATPPDTTGVVSLKAYFPDVPADWHEQIKGFLVGYVNDPSVTGPLSAVLPTFLNCGACQFDALSVNSDNSTVTPGTNNKSNYVVGFKVLVSGADPVSQSLIDTAVTMIPGLLKTEIEKLTIDGLTQQIKDTLVTFASQVKLSQQVVASPKGLWVQATFPAIPSSYVQLYKPLFMKYVYNNGAVRAFVGSTLPPLIGCAAGACSITTWDLIEYDVSTTVSPTFNPTVSPTASPTASPTPEPTPLAEAAAATVPVAIAAVALPMVLLAH